MKSRNLSRRGALGLLTVAGLSACTGTRFNTVAGSEVDEGAFGNPSMQNMMVHTGQAEALGHLNSRFGQAVPTTINFAFNSARLDATARGILDQQADFMRQFPEVRFSVYGHTDLVGSNAYNQRLGRRRARAAVNYLASRGVSTSRLDALVSFGETQPVVATDNRERANRRTVTEVAGFMPGQGLEHDGKYMRIVYRQYVASATSAAEGGGAAGGAVGGGAAVDG